MGSLPTKLRVACWLITLGCFGCSSTDVPEGVWRHPETVENYTQGVRSLVFSPNGSYLVSRHDPLHPWGVRVQLIAWNTNLNLWTVSKKDFYPRSLMSLELDFGSPAFDAQEERLLAYTERGIWNYDLTENTSSVTLYGEILGISPDGEFAILQAEDGSASIRKTNTGEVVSTLDKTDLGQSQNIFSSDSKVLLSCGENGRRYLFEVSTGKTQLEFATGSIQYPICLSTRNATTSKTSDQSLLMAAYETGRNAVGIWSLDTGQLTQTYAHGWKEVWNVALSQNGGLLAVSGESDAKDGERVGLVRFWNLTTGEELEPIRDDSTWGITALAFSPDGTKLATGDGNGIIKLWPLPTEMKPATARE